jgi:hypothetical protein
VITSRIVLVALACAVAAGCGNGGIKAPGTSPVAGTVQLKGGKPAVGVKVTFHPKFDMGAVKFTPSGVTDKDGRFTLSTTAPNDGAPPGEYSVTFELLRAGADKNGQDVEVDVWKGKYADPANGKTVTVQKGDNTLEPFRLD